MQINLCRQCFCHEDVIIQNHVYMQVHKLIKELVNRVHLKSEGQIHNVQITPVHTVGKDGKR